MTEIYARLSITQKRSNMLSRYGFSFKNTQSSHFSVWDYLKNFDDDDDDNGDLTKITRNFVVTFFKKHFYNQKMVLQRDTQTQLPCASAREPDNETRGSVVQEAVCGHMELLAGLGHDIDSTVCHILSGVGSGPTCPFSLVICEFHVH